MKLRSLFAIALLVIQPLYAQEACFRGRDQHFNRSCFTPFDGAMLIAGAGLGAIAGSVVGHTKSGDQGSEGPQGPPGQTGPTGSAGPAITFPTSDLPIELEFTFTGTAGMADHMIWFGQVAQPDETVMTTRLLRSQNNPFDIDTILYPAPVQFGSYIIQWKVPIFLAAGAEPLGTVEVVVRNTVTATTVTHLITPFSDFGGDGELEYAVFTFTNDLAP